MIHLLAAALFAVPSAEQYYARAIEAMRALATPSLVTYDVQVHVKGLGFSIQREKNGDAEIEMPLGRGTDATFAAAHRRNDNTTAVETAQGWGTIRSPFFNPTWDGVNDWIRYGINGRPQAVEVEPVPTPDSSGLPVIGVVRTMGVAFYNVSDGGAARCANGDPAHRVHLVARRNALDHPLTDAVIDERTNHICFVRFEMHQSVIAAGYSSAFELNIADVNGASLVQSGNIDLLARAVGIGVKHMTMSFAYDHFAFPPGASLPH